MLQYPITGTNASEIATSIEEGLQGGRIPAGAMLPTVRRLANSLQLSPTTVAAAYRTLRTRGILTAQGRRGTQVNLRPPLPVRVTTTVPRHLRNLANGNPDPTLLPNLRSVLPRLDLQPRLYGEPANRPRLLALAAQQFAAEHIPTDSLAVLGGALDAAERILQAHLRPGDRVALEDPGYSEIFDLLSALGLIAEPVTIDEYGVLPEALTRALKAGSRACILTPRAQNPTGAAFDERRARELRKILDSCSDVLVVEDDHAGPVAGVPALTVCHRKKTRWAVIRSASKSLGPDLRLAIVAGDATTIARVEGRQFIGAGWVSHILQSIVETLWSTPTIIAQLRVAAETYTTRREAMIAALKRYHLVAYGRSGLNVWVPVPEEVGVVTNLAAAGWAVRGGERYRIKSPPAVRISIATLQPAEASKLAADFAQCLQPQRSTHSV